ncbi:MAG: electron transport complex subunit RsxC [Clostridia bacterium]|nr:electron transport complex subunit RsxC [Clostridia bacterium]
MKAKNGKLFFRGIHIPDKKERSREIPISPLQADEVAIPLKQHIGAPAEPVVTAGDSVKRGQLVGRAAGKISANVHASISGTVTEVAERADGRGGSCVHIVISRGEEQEDEFLPPLAHPSAEEIAARIAEAGIVGMGGAGFPAHVKAAPPVPVDTLILNGAECEPYLTCDDRLMREQTEKIVRGAQYLAVALNATRVMIGIEKNKPEAIALFENTELEVVKLKKQYPMGSEKHLIYCCTGRRVPLGKLPADAGVAVQNVATAFAVCEAVELGKPLIERVVTVSGGGIAEPKNLLCPVGTPLSALAEAEATEQAAKLIAGGPMTGTALTGANGVVTKTTSGFLMLTERETNTEEPTPCINCGKCADVCPMKLLPMQTVFYTLAAKDYELADRYGGVRSCIECGACSYICPARQPIAQAIKTAKAALAAKRGGAK